MQIKIYYPLMREGLPMKTDRAVSLILTKKAIGGMKNGGLAGQLQKRATRNKDSTGKQIRLNDGLVALDKIASFFHKAD